MSRFSRLAVAAALVSAMLASAPAARADDFTAKQKDELGKIIHDYIVQNPEVLREAISELERRQKVAETAQRGAAIDTLAPEIFDSKYQAVVGNPKGKVTLVEFFDYNCGYCKHSLADLERLSKENPDLRIVLRDFPVLGPDSIAAARVAYAVREQLHGDKFWAYHKKLLLSRGRVGKDQALAVAREMGLDAGRIEKDMKAPGAQAGIEEAMHIADKLSLTGTPSWVVGKEVVVGAVGYSELDKKLANVRKCGKTVCS